MEGEIMMGEERGAGIRHAVVPQERAKGKAVVPQRMEQEWERLCSVNALFGEDSKGFF